MKPIKQLHIEYMLTLRPLMVCKGKHCGYTKVERYF